MATAQRRVSPQPYRGVVGHRGLTTFIHIFTIGASGAISSQEPVGNTQVTATKTASKTGRYTLQIPCTFRDLLWADTWLLGPADAAFAGANTGGGPLAIWRQNDIDGQNNDGTIEVQFLNASAYADAELPSGTIVYVRLDAKIGV